MRIVAHKHARDDKTLDRLSVNVEMLDGKRAHSRRRARRQYLPPAAAPAPTARGIDLTVDAPRDVNVRAQTWAGDIDVNGFRAGAELSSRGGEVHACDIEGEVHTNALRGRQRLVAIRGNVDADGVTGDVELDTIDGEVLEAQRGRRADRGAAHPLAAGAPASRRRAAWC